jgi:hypothetical protein
MIALCDRGSLCQDCHGCHAYHAVRTLRIRTHKRAEPGRRSHAKPGPDRPRETAMPDHPAQPTPDGGAVETVGQALTDLAEVYERLPLLTDRGQADPEQAEQSARQLDWLAEELAEAASMIWGHPAVWPLLLPTA